MKLLHHERRSIERCLSKIDAELAKLPFLNLPRAIERTRLEQLRREAAEVFATLEADADECNA